MKDRYLFRGKRVDNGKWVEGDLLQVCSVGSEKRTATMIKETVTHVNDGCIDLIPTEVIPDTVGQCTGLKDKNGKLIFEGDVVSDRFGTVKGPVVFGMPSDMSINCGEYGVEYIGYYIDVDGETDVECRVYFDDVEIIGTIHDAL